MKTTRYIALAGSIVGNPKTWRTVWAWDGTMFDTRAEAIAQGFTLGRSDDFNVGIIDGRTGQLTAIVWMAEDREQDEGELREANQQLGLTTATR